MIVGWLSNFLLRFVRAIVEAFSMGLIAPVYFLLSTYYSNIGHLLLQSIVV